MGEAQSGRNDYTPLGLATPETSAHDSTEYGFDGSIQVEPWREGRYAAIIDLRYSYSVTDKPDEESNHYGILVGLKYFVQGGKRQDPDDVP